MAALIWIPIILPLVLGALSILQRNRAWTLWLPVSAALVLLGVGVALILGVSAGGALTTAAGLLRVDALSA